MKETILEFISTPPLGEILLGFAILITSTVIMSIITATFKAPHDHEKYTFLNAMIYYALLFAAIVGILMWSMKTG
ncbi:MAG TPA: hypothetical protein GXX59_10135 [Syntrophomonadaceae bacterium]|nr:hypothetical protein [Syntrophomonadaceae bacterium]